MGREFNIEIKPTVETLEDACDAGSASNGWRRIPTSLLDFSEGIGTRMGQHISTQIGHNAWIYAASLTVPSMLLHTATLEFVSSMCLPII